MIRRTWARFLFVSACATTGLVASALLVHTTVRDTQRASSLLFYGTPWPVLAFLSALLAWFWARRGQRMLAVLLALSGAVTLALWLHQGWCWNQQTGQRGAVRVVQWNVDRPDWRLPGDVRWLIQQDADFLAIAEREPRKKDLLERWRAAFPAYQLVPSSGQMLCLVRGEVLSVQEGLIDDGSFGTLIHTRIRGREIAILQVDIKASPFADREPPLRQLVKIVGQHRDKNLVVAGDFNTPLESAFFPALRAEAINAFEAAGRGCAATWPRPVPVLSLDQIWTNSGLRAVRCEHFGSWRSDHRAVVAEFDFVP